MALFKILQGQSSKLPTNKVEGYCYVTTDEHKFYVDYKNSDGILDRFALNAEIADKWKTAKNLNGMVVDGTNDVVNYGICLTAAATVEKAVLCSNFDLIKGAEITVKFTTANTASNPTLNVNETGAKNIHYRGSAISASYLAANRTYTFRYNGSLYELVGDINTDTDTKVTNTLNTTTKAYVTGTTSSSTNTGTQIFDTGVYLDTTAGQLTATTFKGALSGNASSASKVNNKLTVGGKEYDGSKAITITASDLGLASAMLFLGTTTTAITDGAKIDTIIIGGVSKKVAAGNVVLYDNKEFVWTGNNGWELLGDEGSYKVKQEFVTNPEDIDIDNPTSDSFIAKISLNNNGEITATRSKVAVVANNPTSLKWGTTSTIGTVAGTDLQVKMPANPNTDHMVELTVIDSSDANWRPAIVGYSIKETEDTAPSTVTNTVYAPDSISVLSSTGTLRLKQLKISSTSAVKHIEFTRGSYNYITAPSSGVITFITDGKAVSSTNADMLIKNNLIIPGTTNTVNLGSSSLKWKNVYATTFNGNATALTSITTSDAAGSNDTWRRLWICRSDNTTGRPAYDDRFVILTSTGTLKAPIFSGSLSGNADTATKLATARTIQTNLSSTSSASFNGTANITPGVTGTLAVGNGGTGGTSFSSGYLILGNGSNALKVTNAHINYEAGTTTSVGYEQLVLGNSTSSGTAGNTYGRITLYTTGSNYIGYRSFNLSSNATRYLVGTTSSDSVGNATLPVYINSDGAIIACTSYSDATVGAATKVTLTLAGSGYTNWRPIIVGASNGAAEDFEVSTVTGSIYSPNSITVQPSTGTLRLKQLKISSTSAVKHIEFMREGANYITAPSSGTINFIADGKAITVANIDMKIGNGLIVPGATNTVNLGTSSLKWKNVYATTFNGELSGNATTATGDQDGINIKYNYIRHRVAYAANSQSSAGSHWYKIAELSSSSANYDEFITFYVNNHRRGYSQASGILTASFATNSTSVMSGTPKLEWDYTNGSIALQDFVLAYNTNTTPAKAELWVQVNSDWDQYHFLVINEGMRTSSYAYPRWTLYLCKGVDSAGTIDSSLTKVTSTIKTIIGSKVYGAVWNDYAEYRICNREFKSGQVVLENGDDTLSIANLRLQRGCSIISDTFGFAIGETEEAKCPIVVSGRVLAYPYESREEFALHIGWPVCSGPNGTVSIMTEEEEEKYPSRIIGTISAVPDYEEWGTDKVKVDGRIWIKVV